MESKKKIVILGGGYGGVHAAKHLYKHFKKNKDIEITLIDRNPYHTLMTELHEIAGSRTEPEAVQISFKKIFSSRSVNVVIDDIDAIDFENQILKSAHKEYPYDFLLLGTGGSPEFFGTEGVQANSYTLWSLEDAIRIRENVELRFRDAAKEPNPEIRKKFLTFVIAGAGFTGIELAGELLDRAEVLCPKYHIDRNDVRIMIVEAKDSVLPILPHDLRKKAENYLRKRGAEVLLNAPITKAEEDKVFLASGSIIETSTFIWTCGIQGGEFTARIGLTKGRASNDKCSIASPEGIHGMAGCHFDEDERYVVGERGRILVTEYMQSVDHRNVYLAGDMIWFLHEEKIVPQIVETAIQSATCAAKNIVADIEKKPRVSFNPKYHGFMVSIGAKYGVAHGMGLSLSGFMAIAAKHAINLHYLFEVAGFNACWAYVQEEFTNVKDRRTITRGHASAKIPAYWSLPARLWLGLMWAIEGVNKIGEGWFNFTGGSKSGWMFSSGVKQASLEATAPTTAVDAASAASEYGEAAAAATPTPTPEAVYDAASAASDAGYANAGDVATSAVSTVTDNQPWSFNLDAPIMPTDFFLVTWFRQLFMDGIMSYIPYQLFQMAIVGTEIAIGLALMGGLMTFGAAAASIGMCLVFTLSGMFTWSQLWFVFMAIVLLGGSGHVLGLDHWVMPWLKKFWNSTKIAQKLYLYDGEPRLGKKNRK